MVEQMIIHIKKNGEVKSKIEWKDIINTDTTLSIVILEILKAYKGQVVGFHNVDNEDVPEQMRTVPEIFDSYLNISVSEKYKMKYEYILDEMIYTFDEISKGINYLEKYNNEKMSRVKNGLRLFSKYFTSLWI